MRAEVFFATSNKGKLGEAQLILRPYGIKLRQLSESKSEIQADDLEEIAGYAAAAIANGKSIAVLVEDSGLFIRELAGFPGPYSAYVHRTVGLEGVLKLLAGVADRSAKFRTVAAFCRPSEVPKCFTGEVSGIIVRSPRGSGGFGFDPIFAPDMERSRTFAQMTPSEKNQISHRSQALRRFGEWFTGLTGSSHA